MTAPGPAGAACVHEPIGGRVLGIDPGSRLLGYGIVDARGSRLKLVAAGTLKASGTSFVERLVPLCQQLAVLAKAHRPSALAIETAFAGKNVHSALVLGQVRGAVIVTLATLGLPVFEYTPSTVKLAACGHGAADKQQVQHMVAMLLGLGRDYAMGLDTSDALAVAICHAQQGHLARALHAGAAMRAAKEAT